MMNSERASFAALDDVLTHTRYLLIDFDGPICSLFAGTPTAPIADRLRKVLTQDNVRLPQAIQSTPKWFEILAFAASISSELAARVERELTRLELAAVPTARPSAYIDDVLAACRESARPAAIISNNSDAAVHVYLEAHDLSNQIKVVAARTGPDPAMLKPSPYLIHQAATALEVAPSACAVVGDSEDDIQAATAAGARSIGYANKPAKREPLSASGSAAIITSLADLALRLRARPIPPGL